MAVQFEGDYKRTSEYRFYPEDIALDPEANGRHETPDIEWLITDILARGQHTPVIIRNDGGVATLVAGFSRWRAISEINKRKLAPVRMQIRATYQQCTAAEAFLVNISENRFRNPTTELDDAHNIKRLINVYAMTEEQIAELYFPTAKTEAEIKEALKFVRERTKLLTLTQEAADAVRSGRVKGNAAKAIAKLTEDQQREVLASGKDTIERKDLRTQPASPRAPKGVQKDAELMRRVTAVLEDVEGVLDDNANQYIEVDRVLLLNLSEYVKELKTPKAA